MKTVCSMFDVKDVFLGFHAFTLKQLYNYIILFGFTARQDYFIRFEPSQSLCGAKTGDPREKPPDHPQVELGLSHM